MTTPQSTSRNEVTEIVKQYAGDNPALLRELDPAMRRLETIHESSKEFDQLRADIYRTILENHLHTELSDMPWEELQTLDMDPKHTAKLLEEFRTIMQEEKVDQDVVESFSFIAALKPEIDAVIEKNKQLMQEEDYERMEKNLYEFVEGAGKLLMETKLSDEQKEKVQAALIAILKQGVEGMDKRALAVTVASEGANFIPIIGGIKMIGEAAKGSKADGQALKGDVRLWHLADGILTLGLDAATLGTSKLAKGGIALFKWSKKFQQGGKFLTLAKKLERVGLFYKDNAELLQVIAKHGKRVRKGVRADKKRVAVEQKKDELLEKMYAIEQQVNSAMAKS